MKEKANKNRRQFLKNAALAGFSLSLAPMLARSETLITVGGSALAECNKTTLDYYGQGPFYSSNPPQIVDNKLAKEGETGERMIITGRVFNLDCTEFIPNCTIDIWHANDQGAYDNDGFNLRGVTKSNAQGFYVFETIMPGKYLNGAKYRPAHIHFKITPPDGDTVITQLYFEGDSDLETDAASSIKSGTYDASHRIIKLTANAANVLEGSWDMVVDGDGTIGTNDLHLDKGLIYQVSPNPFTDQAVIKYGVFAKSRVSILVFDIQGREVATLQEAELTPQKYEAIWQPDASLPKGYYFIALKINDLQVHYLKIVKI
ncbi:MAG: protocatechuate 3,4-dioxygenase beta subunit [Bacteroidia bacterium]|jgi:protocatechuate 3,4-dioxygenase beta subunit